MVELTYDSELTPIVRIAAKRDLALAAMKRFYEAPEDTTGPYDSSYDDAVVLVYEIEDAIMAAPVTCAGDLAIKAATLERQSKEGLICPDDVAKLLADVQAFGGMPAVG